VECRLPLTVLEVDMRSELIKEVLKHILLVVLSSQMNRSISIGILVVQVSKGITLHYHLDDVQVSGSIGLVGSGLRLACNVEEVVVLGDLSSLGEEELENLHLLILNRSVEQESLVVSLYQTLKLSQAFQVSLLAELF
jgi:hypothetical protein